MKTLTNISYENLYEFEKYRNDAQLNNMNFFEIVKELHPNMSGNLVTFDPKRKTTWNLVMTELGMCFTVNSVVTNLFAVNRTNIKLESILRCHYLNGLCYARYDSDPQRHILV